ncbi:hypothetical protein [Bacillus wiedmannii]|uniref:hypothetical protein n=1 Tax=Bacillus wiedmannii TaxID=1890302 RepID=UPI0015CF4C1C|nr:hypothetical protein [Bacillus wiedmannii]
MIGETFKNLLLSLAGLIVGLSAIYLILKYSFKLTVEKALPNLTNFPKEFSFLKRVKGVAQR